MKATRELRDGVTTYVFHATDKTLGAVLTAASALAPTLMQSAAVVVEKRVA
jgi:hypothetical protein